MEESLYPWKRIWRTLYRGNQNNEERVEFSPRPNPSRKILRQLIQHSSTVTGNGKCSHACALPRELQKNRDNFFCIPAQKFSLFLQTAWLLPGMEDYKDVVTCAAVLPRQDRRARGSLCKFPGSMRSVFSNPDTVYMLTKDGSFLHSGSRWGESVIIFYFFPNPDPGTDRNDKSIP